MKIISWNVNGLRAVAKKENWEEILKLSPDILAIQETKATPDQLPKNVETIDGYHSYFDSSQMYNLPLYLNYPQKLIFA